MGRKKAGVSRFNAQNTAAEDGQDAWKESVARYSKPKLAESTEISRARIFSDWNQFISLKHPEVDPEKVWELIIRDDHQSKLLVLDFIDRYIMLSGRPTRASDTTDKLKQRPVTCVSTANGAMKQLIAAAEAEFIRPQRQRDPDKAWMQLARPQGTDVARDIGPVRDITRWIATTLKDKWGLTIDSEYSKTGATAEDLQMLLRTLWERADHIPMPPINRVMFHMFLLILFLPGCRPGMVPNLRWKDIILWLKRDVRCPGGRRLKASLTLFRNKRKRDALLVGSDEDRFELDLAMMPTPLLCFTHLLLALAFKLGALRTEYKCVKDVIHQPILDNNGCTTLEWKKEMLEKRVITLSYPTFRSYWSRLCTVAGFETVPRPYALHVGAGEAINKHTTSTTRCFIMGHTNKTFQKDYQSRNIRVDLQQIQFGDLAGVTEDLPRYGLSRRYDPCAPIYATQGQINEIDAGASIQELRSEVASLKARGADAGEIRAAEGILNYWRSRFKELALLKRRKEYFRQTAQLRQEHDEAGLRSLQEDPYLHYDGPGQHLRLGIDRLMHLWAPGTVFDEAAEARSLAAMQWLIFYMEGSFELIPRAPRDTWPLLPASAYSQDEGDTQTAAMQRPGGSEQAPSGDESISRQEMEPTQEGSQALTRAFGVADEKEPVRPTCFICGLSFGRRNELTRHAQVHRATLSSPFQCPECKRQGLEPSTTQTPSQWSNHVERAHGKQHAPNFPEHLVAPTSKASTAAKVTCALCNGRVSVHDLVRHINENHVGGFLADRCKIITCPACPNIGNLSIDTYVIHISAQHGAPPMERCPFCRVFLTQRGLVTHIRAHFRRSSSPLPCPICEQQGKGGPCFEDYLSWRIHAIRAPGHLLEDSALAPVYSPDAVLGVKRKAEEELTDFRKAPGLICASGA